MFAACERKPMPTVAHKLCRLLDALEAQRHPHAAADAQRRYAATRTAAQHLVQQRDRDARARAADRMPERDGAAVDVEAVAVEMQLAVAGDHLRRECFVEFD